MEKKIFKTIIRGDQKLGAKDYVLGRISGIMYVVTGEEWFNKSLVFDMRENGDNVFQTVASNEQYFEFKRIVEDLYPGLCIFDDIN